MKQGVKVAMIIPMKGRIDLISDLLFSIEVNNSFGINDGNHLDIFIADTGSSDEEKKLLKSVIKKSKIKDNISLLEYDYYNFAKINNDVVKNYVSKDTDLILLCNNDVQLINDAISIVVSEYYKHKDVGTVGALLLYPNLTIQHAGIKYEVNKEGNPVFGHLRKFSKFKYKSDSRVYRTWGNTGAFMLTSYSDYMRLGGLSESYKDCFEDVEYNIRMLFEGRSNYTCLNALCFHKESETRHQKMSENDINRVAELVRLNNRLMGDISVGIHNDL